LSEDDIAETSNVKCTGRFEGSGVDVVDVVETASFWDSSFCLMFLEYHPPTKKGGNVSTCSIMMNVNFIFQNTVP
jgi:hypothetical protein